MIEWAYCDGLAASGRREAPREAMHNLRHLTFMDVVLMSDSNEQARSQARTRSSHRKETVDASQQSHNIVISYIGSKYNAVSKAVRQKQQHGKQLPKYPSRDPSTMLSTMSLGKEAGLSKRRQRGLGHH